MDKGFHGLLDTPVGAELYSGFVKAIEEYGMRDMIRRGVLVGLSGGADSVTLLLLLLRYREMTEDFPIVAAHVNHGIRGDEAKRDERFSKELAEGLGVEIFISHVDCPLIREENGGSLEEIARNARYAEFSKIIASRNDISVIAVAHNADDNLETVLFNLMRGAGTAGLAGIPPVRENIVRPMILLKKSDILQALDAAQVPYVTDSTNLCEDYSRNHIRSRIIPALNEYSDQIHSMAARASLNLRTDNSYIDGVASDFIAASNGSVSSSSLNELHPAVKYRVIKQMAHSSGCRAIESVHIRKISELLCGDNFSYSLPSEYSFVCERGLCRVIQKNVGAGEFFYRLNEEITEIPEFSAAVVISDSPVAKTFSNVYNFSIQAKLSSAIINSGVYIRNRRDGDSYRYAGMTHKLKKLFNDRGVPSSLRDRIPVLCDSQGILWVPGFGVRDGAVDACTNKTVTLLVNDLGGAAAFYIPKR